MTNDCGDNGVGYGMTRFFVVMICLASLMVPTLHVRAQEKVDLIGSYRDWDAFTLRRSDEKLCYITSMPKNWSASRKGVNRGDIFIIVTHRPKAAIRDEVNIVIGYPFRSGSEAQVVIDGGKGLAMFTQGDGAWNHKSSDDAAMVQAMKRGNKMVVKGTSSRGTTTRDNYSLSGFTAAYNAMTQACS